ncbi:MAG: sensor histidine kinase [Alkalispirochaetaceae bacterium]
MSDSAGSGRLTQLRRLIETRVRECFAPGDPLSEELFELLEQLDAEDEELLRGRGETERLHRRFADLYEYAPVGYMVLNADRIVVQANETARNFFGAQAIDLGRSAIGPNITPETRDNYYRALRRSREGGEPDTAEFEIRRADGRVLWLSARIACETGAAGEVTGYRVVLSDISDRVIAERRAEARRVEVETLLEEKELLLREIHHRVKNDFGLVSSFLQLQAADADSPALRQGMEEARSRVQVTAHIYDILHRQEQYRLVELKPFLEQIVSGFFGGARNSEVAPTMEIEELTVPSSTGVGLGLVANELLTNAMKYAAGESEAFEIALSLRQTEGGTLELQVADTGPGLPEPVRSGSSFGFGLTVVQALAEQHDGSMTLENRGGAVITVRVRLPA